MRRKVTKLLGVVTIMALFVGLASFAFADTGTLGKVKEYSGTVSFTYDAGFIIKTGNGDVYKLMLGPAWYLDEIGLKLKNGDRVTIKGVADDNYHILFVGTLKRGTKTYNIADLENLKNLYYSPMMWRGPRHRRW